MPLSTRIHKIGTRVYGNPIPYMTNWGKGLQWRGHCTCNAEISWNRSPISPQTKKQMNKYFKQEDGSMVDILEHSVSQLQAFPDMKIHIATDSQNYGANTVYATVIVFRYGLKGAHYIYNKQRLPRIRNHFNRLYKEGELTIECAEYLTNNTALKVHALEFDYNNSKKTASTNLVPIMKGWAESLGYKASTKPDLLIATKAADHLARL